MKSGKSYPRTYQGLLVVQGGTVNIIYGSRNRLSGARDQIWHQDKLPGSNAEVNERFGFSLAAGDRFGSVVTAGDFNGNGKINLAIGVPFESAGNVHFAGATNAIYGRWNGLHKDKDQIRHHDTPGIYDRAERGDFFGA